MSVEIIALGDINLILMQIHDELKKIRKLLEEKKKDDA